MTRTRLPFSATTGSARCVVMREARRDLLVGGRQGDPQLQSVQRLAAGAMIGRGALRMHDAAAGGHQVHVARMNRDGAAEAVAVHDLAVEQERDGGEPDMRMRPHVDALAGAEFDRPEVIEEDERADHAAAHMRQCAAHREAAEVDAARHDDEVDGVAGGLVAGSGIGAGCEAHGRTLRVFTRPQFTVRRAVWCRSACHWHRA